MGIDGRGWIPCHPDRAARGGGAGHRPEPYPDGLQLPGRRIEGRAGPPAKGWGDPVIRVRNLRTNFYTDDGVVQAVRGVNFHLEAGETLGIVGESGCGKRVTALSILGLVQEPGRVVDGEILFKGEDLLKMSEEEVRDIRGRDIAMIFQDP